MNIGTGSTYKLPTVTAVACCTGRYLRALATLHLLWFFDLLKGVLDLKEMVNVEGRLEVGYSSRRGEEGGSSAGGAAYGDLSLLVLDHQSLETLLAVDVETLEQFWIFEGIEADGTRELVLQLLERLCLGLRRHTQLTTADATF